MSTRERPRHIHAKENIESIEAYGITRARSWTTVCNLKHGDDERARGNGRRDSWPLRFRPSPLHRSRFIFAAAVICVGTPSRAHKNASLLRRNALRNLRSINVNEKISKKNFPLLPFFFLTKNTARKEYELVFNCSSGPLIRISN